LSQAAACLLAIMVLESPWKGARACGLANIHGWACMHGCHKFAADVLAGALSVIYYLHSMLIIPALYAWSVPSTIVQALAQLALCCRLPVQ
jgi:hypothetical protein